MPHHRQPLKIGHRGAAGHAPENSILALKKGVELGADFVEFDVRRTSDGTLVLFHDRTLGRMTADARAVCDVPWSRLRNLEISPGQTIPTLRDALTAISGGTGVMIELKEPHMAAEVCQAVDEVAFSGPVIYASFWHHDLLAIRRQRPSTQTLALIEAVPVNLTAFAEEACVTHVGLALDCVHEAYVSALHRKEMAVFVYTVDEPADIQRLAAIGVDGIISNFPDRL
ncbi:MAG: glycerophosphodiester phosphodiesterase [Nitrospiraceae bacterium]|nr:glycerophosphodiester phosphodiesterase [Nitrospiraceae bacterium]